MSRWLSLWINPKLVSMWILLAGINQQRRVASSVCLCLPSLRQITFRNKLLQGLPSGHVRGGAWQTHYTVSLSLMSIPATQSIHTLEDRRRNHVDSKYYLLWTFIVFNKIDQEVSSSKYSAVSSSWSSSRIRCSCFIICVMENKFIFFIISIVSFKVDLMVQVYLSWLIWRFRHILIRLWRYEYSMI